MARDAQLGLVGCLPGKELRVRPGVGFMTQPTGHFSADKRLRNVAAALPVDHPGHGMFRNRVVFSEEGIEIDDCKVLGPLALQHMAPFKPDVPV